MTTYILDFVTGEYRDAPSHQGCFAFTMYKYYFNINKRGNVKIKEQNIFVCSGHPNEHGVVKDILVINDNIPIPSYLIETLKTLITYNFIHNSSSIYRCHWICIIETIKQLKQSLKELTENPQKETNIQILLDNSIVKNEILEKQLKDTEQKIENLQTAYFDTLQDNKKIKEENKLLKDKILKLESEIRNRKDIVYINGPEPQTLFSYCGGGSNSGTMSNAQNRMLYNDIKGIYEPEEDE
jgi:hypothetical protein